MQARLLVAAIDARDCHGGRAQVRSYRWPRSDVGADLAAIDVWNCFGVRARVRSYRWPRSHVGADLAAIDAWDCCGGRDRKLGETHGYGHAAAIVCR